MYSTSFWGSTLHQGVTGRGGDAAVVILVPGHTNVTVLAPAGSPAKC